MFFLSVHHLIPRNKLFWTISGKFLLPNALETFCHGSIFNKAVFCFGKKQFMSVNNEYSSWYSEVGDFIMSVWDRRNEVLYGNGSVWLNQSN